MSSRPIDPAAPPRRLSVATGRPGSAVAGVLAALAAAVDAVLDLEPTSVSDTELVALLDGVERQARRMPAARDTLIVETAARGIPARVGARSTAAYLARRYRLAPGEAHGWVKAAGRYAPARSLSTGELLPPALAVLGGARRNGHVSAAQERVIAELMDRLPAAVGPAGRHYAERGMVARAREFDPATLTKLGQRILDHLDPDGHYTDPAEVRRRRGLSLGTERDGLTPLTGHLDAWTAAALRAVLEPLAAPGRLRDCPDTHEPPTAAGATATASTDDADAAVAGAGAAGAPDAGEPGAATKASWDTRSTPQRMHDALTEALERLLGAGALPRKAGLPATILLSTRLSDLEAATGLVSTAHGGLIPVADVIRHATKARLIDIVLDQHGNPLFLGRRRRLAGDAIRYALTVRDRGCVIPGCTVPATRTEAHHLTDWAHGGLTDIDKMALLCPYDHDHITGWTLYLKNGRIWCIPPPGSGLDPTPKVNDYFHDPPIPDLE